MIEQIIDSNLKTKTLEEMHTTTLSMIRRLKVTGGEPKELIGWKNKLSTAISIRKAMNAN